MLRKLMGLLVCTLVISATAAVAGVPDLDLSSAAIPSGTEGTQVTVYNLPNGNGVGFDEAKALGGATFDATITLTLLDGNGDAIPNFPFEDMWVQSSAGTFFACTNGTTADANTDADGQTQWQNALLAGGFSDPASDVTQVYISGAPLNQPGLDVQYNSADLSGDGVVNLTDIGQFATAYFGAYAYKADFIWDGALNLSDIGRLAQGNGAACP
jgi:hypothetical protein